jgi:protein tyrosine phosphatase
MARSKLVNGVLVSLTSEEETQLNAKEIDWANGAADRHIARLREERNARLAETDYFGFSDVTMTDAMSTYRQALRDITDTYSSLDDVVWPEKP